MSGSPLHQTRFEAIEAYLLGTMPVAERERFELEMAGDDTLRAEVQLQRENMLAVELGGFRRSLRSMMEQDRPEERPVANGWGRYLRHAAAIALLISVAIWWTMRPDANERLFAEHFTADPGLPVPMSISHDPVFHDAMVAYKLGDYDEARTKWAPLLQARPGNDTLRYYIASAALAAGDPGPAIPLFRSVAADSTSRFQVKARWYLFLAYVRTGDHAGMDSLALDDDPAYGERVRTIRDRIKR